MWLSARFYSLGCSNKHRIHPHYFKLPTDRGHVALTRLSLSGDTDTLPPLRKAVLFVRNGDSTSSHLLTHLIGVARGRLRDPYRSGLAPLSRPATALRCRRRARSRRVGLPFPLAIGAVATAPRQNARAKQVLKHPCIFLGLCSAPSCSPLGRPLRGFAARLWSSPLWGPLAPFGRCGLAAPYGRALGGVRSAPTGLTSLLCRFFLLWVGCCMVQGQDKCKHPCTIQRPASFCVIHLTRKEKNRLFPAAYPLRIITQNIIHFA